MATLPNDTATAHHRDNLLGVCASLGAATGIDPLIFRIGFILSMLVVSFEMTLIAYAVAAVAFFTVSKALR